MVLRGEEAIIKRRHYTEQDLKANSIPANYLELKWGSASAKSEPSRAGRYVLTRVELNMLRLSSQE